MEVDEYSHNFWENEKRVAGYHQRDYLHKAEEKIITLFKEGFNEIKMLDMGVGGGRTTLYFAELVKEYFGADYSKAMINACKKRFSKASYSTNFFVLDVRSMDIFEDKFFEFILFSVNGLDYIAHEDKLIALKELIRVNKPGGFLYFSSNNLLYVNNVFKFRKHPRKLLRNIYKYYRIRQVKKNYRLFKKMVYTLIKSYPIDFKVSSYFITPEEAIKPIYNAGYRSVRVFLHSAGEEYKNNQFENLTQEPCLWYLCEV